MRLPSLFHSCRMGLVPLALLLGASLAHAGSLTVNVVVNSDCPGAGAVAPGNVDFGAGVGGNTVQTPVPGALSYFYRWKGDTIDDANFRASPLNVAVGADEALEIQAYFSLEAAGSPGYGDYDCDGLVDDWEIQYELDPESGVGADGPNGNQDGDLIPSLGYIYPWTTGGTGYQGGGNFRNILEQGGLDLDYSTTADNPGTDPTNEDTDGDGLPDGWEYYWYIFRNVQQGLTWVVINPTAGNSPDGTPQGSDDDDEDGLTNLQEYEAGTNPTHCDTDGDGIDDKWELDNGLNPLLPNDASENPDGDRMAHDGLRYHDAVYRKGAAEMSAGSTSFDPRTAWNDGSSAHPDTADYRNIDEYLGRDRLPRIIWGQGGPNDGRKLADAADDATNPQAADTDADKIPDGWELYVGLNPKDGADAGNDTDGVLAGGDGVSHVNEWNNMRDVNGNAADLGTWTNKLWPTDPGAAVNSATYGPGQIVFSWRNVWISRSPDPVEYEAVADLAIFAGGNTAFFSVPSGSPGSQDDLYYRDANFNGRWDFGEDLWKDVVVNGIYDEPGDTRVYGGGDAWGTGNGLGGSQGGVYYFDADASTDYTVGAAGEGIWREQDDVFVAARDFPLWDGNHSAGIVVPDGAVGYGFPRFYDWFINLVVGVYWVDVDTSGAFEDTDDAAYLDYNDDGIYNGEPIIVAAADLTNTAHGVGQMYVRWDDVDASTDYTPGDSVWIDTGTVIGEYDGGDVVIAGAPAVTDAGELLANVVFRDTNDNGAYDAAEGAWIDEIVLDGLYTHDVQVYPVVTGPADIILTDGDVGSQEDLYYYHNDPHPHDTDFDGLEDGDGKAKYGNIPFGERNIGSNPTSVDSDTDALPDGWEVYAGSQPRVADASAAQLGNLDPDDPEYEELIQLVGTTALDDPDQDGVANNLEYWTGTVYEWMHLDIRRFPNVKLVVRQPMIWDSKAEGGFTSMRADWLPVFIPPDFVSCPSFDTGNDQRARTAEPYVFYHTTRADRADTDDDGMDDFWEIYHGLNPTKGSADYLAVPRTDGTRSSGSGAKAGPFTVTNFFGAAPYFTFGAGAVEFTTLSNAVVALAGPVGTHVGPFNFGLELMDPDGDGLPNLEEYAYEQDVEGRAFYHTDPTPYQRTDPATLQRDLLPTRPKAYSFVRDNYVFDNSPFPSKWRWVKDGRYPFIYEQNEGFDTDNDMFGDYAELSSLIPNATGGSDPLQSLDPVRNRAAFLVATNQDFLRTIDSWIINTPNHFTRFSVEAWVLPTSTGLAERAVVERSFQMQNDPLVGRLAHANFRLGLVSNNLPFVMYNGRGTFFGTPIAAYAIAPSSRRVPVNVWTHLAATYDGQYLRLYVNGSLARERFTQEIPATGYNEDTPHKELSTTIIGASEAFLSTNLVFSDLVLGPDPYDTGERWNSAGYSLNTLTWQHERPVPVVTTNHFDGYIDEVRIWNGVRTASELAGNRERKLSRSGDTASTTVTLDHYFTFDESPDVDATWTNYDGTAAAEPRIPANITAIQGARWPYHRVLPSWDLMPQKSQVYYGFTTNAAASNRYNYLVIAEDLALHEPLVPARDDYYNAPRDTNGAFTGALPAGYKNPANPYEWRSDITRWAWERPVRDMVFLNGAEADGDVFLNYGSWLPGITNNPDANDADGDGLPDDWETKNGLDPFSSIGSDGPDGDPDGDGLSNYTEYLIRTDPHDPDSDGDGIYDSLEDFDGDGLGNAFEQNTSFTQPHRVDTDDDGVGDGVEVNGTGPGNRVTNPLQALDPLKFQALGLGGDGHVVVNAQERHRLRSWTVQAWVWPSNAADGVILTRRMTNLLDGYVTANYELGVWNDAGTLRPYAQFSGVSATNVSQVYTVRVDGTRSGEITGGQQVTAIIAPEQWTHVAGTYDSASHTLSLFVNGELASYRTDAFLPPGWDNDRPAEFRSQLTVGGGPEVAGLVTDGFEGYLDEVQLFGGAATGETVLEEATGVSPLASVYRATASGPAYQTVRQLPVAEATNFPHKANQLLVRFKTGMTTAQATNRLASLGTGVVRSYSLLPIHLVQITDGSPVATKLNQLRQDADVLYAEPNYRIDGQVTPNDPQYSQLYGLHNTGQSGGKSDADIDAPEAWDRETGDSSVIVAIIDSGVEYTHPDLAGNIWNNPGEVAGNGLDDDANGYVDDVYGWDWYNNDNDPADDYGHGTHVAGTVGAVGNNGVGVVGVNWNVKLMSLKFLGDLGFGFTDGAIAAVEYAWRNGARISNNSWGSYGFSQSLYDAIQAAGANDHLFVAAAGNFAFDNDTFPYYPASYDLDNILSVGASDRSDALADFSNYGAQTVDLLAPGVGILSTYIGGGYGSLSGTSMATPHSAGAAALTLAANSGVSAEVLKKILMAAADEIPAAAGITATDGRLNAGNAVGGAGSPVLYFNFDDGGVSVEDFSVSQDWKQNWAHAGRFVSGAAFATNEFVELTADSDEDGIPDWWEELTGLDPLSSTGDDGADGDPDGDGLSNLYEYYLYLNPFLADTDRDGTTDFNEDADGDGISNGQEQTVTHTRPDLADTDDDGVDDATEHNTPTDPLWSYSPENPRAVEFAGDARLRVRSESPDDVATNWTIEAWVRPETASESGIILRRAEKFGLAGSRWVHYELGLDTGIPYVRYSFRQGGTNVVTEEVFGLQVVSNVWTHLAAVQDIAHAQLRLYVDGKRVAYEAPAQLPPPVPVGNYETVIGGGDLLPGPSVANGFNGQIDAVRVWSYNRTGLELQEGRLVQLPEFTDQTPDLQRSPQRVFNFDDGGLSYENSVYTNDWEAKWKHAAQAEGNTAAVLHVAAPYPPENLDQDDDFLADLEENANGWRELRAESPYRQKYLTFDGTGRVWADEQVDGEETGRYATTNWTVEAWVRARTAPTGTVPLVTRRSKSGDIVNYEIGLINTGGVVKAYARYQSDDAGHPFITLVSGPTVPVGTTSNDWAHVAATFSNQFFALFLNGMEVIRSADTFSQPHVGKPGYVQLGSTGFVGDLKEVRIWNDTRSYNEIEEGHHRPLLFSAALIENTYDGASANAAFLGRDTTDPEDGLIYDYSAIGAIDGVQYLSGRWTHKFTLEAWIRMQPGAEGGIVAERKIDVLLIPNEPDWRINHSLRVTDEGKPQVYWMGEVTVLTPVRESNVVVRFDAAQEIITRTLTSEVDIRDGQWHHLAAVGDSQTVKIYIDSVLDVESLSYYVFRARDGDSFESFYYTYMPVGSVLRVADDQIQAEIDEVMFWNEDRTATEVDQHRRYGLSNSDLRRGLAFIDPLPANAVDDGEDHQDLVSYLIFDGEIVPPFVPDYANDTLPYRMLAQPAGAEIKANSRSPVYVDRLRSYRDQLMGYFAADDGGQHAEQFMERNDYGYAGQLLGGVAFAAVGPGDAVPYIEDIDGDNLPDWWETLYGLDPGENSGANGAWGDLDGDGLNNRAEFLAGTDPYDFDTNGDGISDYDTRDVSGATYGELYDDGDGMADAWESQYPSALSPLRHDSQEDPDLDGWDNYSEFMSLTDPTDSDSFPQPELRVKVRYNGVNNNGPILYRAYSDASMDAIPDARGSIGPSDPVSGNIYEVGEPNLVDHNDTLPAFPVVPGSVEICVPAGSCQLRFVDDGSGGLRTVDTDPVRFGTIDYETGEWTLSTFPAVYPEGTQFSATWRVRQDITSFPFEGSLSQLDIGHLRQGPAWIFAFIDNNANSSFDPGEPAGIAEGQPLQISWAGPIEVNLGLTDSLPGYQRFAWSAISNTVDFTVRVVRTTSAGTPLVLLRPDLSHRTYFHEGDYLYSAPQATWGLPNGESFLPGFSVTVNGGSGSNVFSFNWSSNLATPRTISPFGGEVVYARSELVWTQDYNSTHTKLEIRRSTGGPTIYSGTFIPPFRNADGTYRLDIPLIGGDGVFTNDVYYWRVASANPARTSAWSSWTAFSLDLNPAAAGAYAINGTLTYYGRVTNGNFVVQAFQSRGFGGLPDAQVSLGTNRGPFTLLGLRAGTYVVRAFLDMDGDKTLDPFESFGYVKSTATQQGYAGVREITLPGNAEYLHLIIRDQDTDNDNIPDAWEIRWFGNLTSAGFAGSYSDSDGDGLDDYQEYLHGTDPTDNDSDNDGLWDSWEVNAGLDPLNADMDGDGLTDGAEYLTHNSNPLNPDTDGDGLKDGLEVAKGSSPLLVDTDNDGFNDPLEVVQGFNPANTNSKPASIYLFEIVNQSLTMTLDVVRFDFVPQVTNIVTNVLTRLQMRTNLILGDVQNIPQTERTITAPTWTFGPWDATNAVPPDDTRFYMIQWEVP